MQAKLKGLECSLWLTYNRCLVSALITKREIRLGALKICLVHEISRNVFWAACFPKASGRQIYFMSWALSMGKVYMSHTNLQLHENQINAELKISTETWMAFILMACKCTKNGNINHEALFNIHRRIPLQVNYFWFRAITTFEFPSQVTVSNRWNPHEAGTLSHYIFFDVTPAYACIPSRYSVRR